MGIVERILSLKIIYRARPSWGLGLKRGSPGYADLMGLNGKLELLVENPVFSSFNLLVF